MVVRFRRSTGDERLQLKWFVAAAAVVAVTFSLGFFSDTVAASLAASLSLAFLDVAIALAILKYRLYDIDVIIGKTIVYGVLAAFITGIYVIVVVVIGAFIGVTEGLSLLATAIVAVAFQPIRQRAQHVANRLVYGKRATPYEVLSEFSEHVGEAYAGEDILLADGAAARGGDRDVCRRRVAEGRVRDPAGGRVALERWSAGSQTPHAATRSPSSPT